MKPIIFILFSLFILNAGQTFPQSQSDKTVNTDSTKAAEQAYKMINSPEPKFKSNSSVPLTNNKFPQLYKSEPCKFLMRDSKHLFAQKFVKKSNTTIIVLHGVLSSSLEMNRTSGLLREDANAEVYAIDLRGHGRSDGTPGDVDYIGQYSDDLADVVKSIKKEEPENKIILAGHSMGGGIILRYAMRKNVPPVDGYLLLAPLLGQNTPTFPKPGAAQNNSDEFMKIDITRIIGLKIYNSIGVHKYDNLPVLFFNLPEDAAIKTYSYRSDQSMAPDDYRKGLEAVNKPLLVIVGSNDEAFVASEFKPAVTGYSNGKVIIIKGATHDSIIYNKKAMKFVEEWMKKYKLTGGIKR